MKPSGYSVFKFDKNTLGLNTRDSLAGMNPQSSSDLLNVDFDTRGAIRKRRGYVKLNSSRVTEDNCLGLINYKTKAGDLFAVSIFDDKVYKMDDLDGTWDDITNVVSLTDDQDNFMKLIIGQDTVIGTNGTDAPIKWTGAGNAAALSIANFTHAKDVLYYKNRLIFAHTTEGGTKFPNRIRWSNVGTIETYTATDYTDESETEDGAEIVGMAKLYDEIYVFKNSSSSGIKRLYYTGQAVAPFGVINIGDVGAVSRDAIVNIDIPGIGSGLIYWGIDNKIRFFDGNQSVDIADHIQPTLDGINRSRAKHIQAVNYPELNQVWFSVSYGSSTTQDKVIIYDYHNKAFLVHDNIDANALGILEDSSENKLLCTGGYAGLVYKQNTGNNDDSNDFNSYYWTAWLDLGDPTLAKKFRWLDLYIAELGDYNLTLGYNFDFNTGVKKSAAIRLSAAGAVFGTAVFGTDAFSGQTVLIKRIPTYGTNRERYIRYKFENNNADQPFTIYRFDVLAKMLNLRNID